MKRFLKSLGFAIEGLKTAAKEQPNLRIHLAVFLCVIAAGLICDITFNEWLIVILVCGFVIATEVVNSAIEKVVDLASPSIHPLAKQAKDLGAAAVLIAAITSVAVGLLIFGKYLLNFLSDYL